MCGICGCGEDHEHHHHHDEQMIQVEQDIFAKNNEYALHNKTLFEKKGITAINFMSSPGSGKTRLLAKTISDNQLDRSVSVIVADQQTDYDAQQFKASGAKVKQINTGKVCHLDAHMLGHAVEELQLDNNALLFIENIGNLVCPALFDLGEVYKVVILSVTEGDNKPLKYPNMFRAADLMLITKTDLLPYVPFDLAQCIKNAKAINPNINVIEVSATSGKGLDDWYSWLSGK